MKFGAKPCGSFCVLGDEAPEHSDADFFILESQVRDFEAKFLPQFVKENFTNYADRFTVGLYVLDLSNDPDTPVCDKSNRIEVTVKKDEYAEAYDLMWSILCTNPDIFKTKLWQISSRLNSGNVAGSHEKSSKNGLST